jgi:putative FmdB family regulatory protein
MPIFEYECPTCNKRFDKLVRGGTPAEVPCPDCGATDTRRVLSTFASFGSGGSASSFGSSASCAPSGGG